jgi:Na+/H+ antiporter NhaD/arsenite permease-like protein
VKGEKCMLKVILIIPEIILGLIFILGILNFIFPRKMWETFEGWKATKEPTDAFFTMRRIAGIFVMLIVLAMLLFPYIMSKLK